MYLVFFSDKFRLNNRRYLCLWLLLLLPFLFAMRFQVANAAVGKKATYIFSCRIRSPFISLTLRLRARACSVRWILITLI